MCPVPLLCLQRGRQHPHTQGAPCSKIPGFLKLPKGSRLKQGLRWVFLTLCCAKQRSGQGRAVPTLTSCAVSWSRALRLLNSLAARPAAARAPLARGKRPWQGWPAPQAELLSRGHSSPWQRAGVHGSTRAPPHTWAGREQLEWAAPSWAHLSAHGGANTAPQGWQALQGSWEPQELCGHRRVPSGLAVTQVAQRHRWHSPKHWRCATVREEQSELDALP